MESKGADASARAAQVAAVLDAACALRRAHDSNVGWSDDELLEGAQALVGEGNERLQRGDARGALQKYEECRAFGQAMRDRKRAMAVEGAAVGNLGDAYRRLGQYKKAIEHHTMALAISREIGDREGEGNHLGNLGNAYDSLGQYKKAIEHHTMALAICRKIGDREGEGNHLGNLGSAYDSLGQYKKAIEHHTMALAISRKIGDRQGEGGTLGGLGNAYDSLGQYKKAIEHHTMALAISREIGDKQGEGSDLGNLGIAYFRLGQYEKAIEHHTMALAISREIGDKQVEGNALGNLGGAYLSLGQYEKAIEHYTMALKISREIGDRQGEGNGLGGLGIAYFRLGQYEKAIEHHTMALDICRKIGHRQGEGGTLGGLGNAYHSLGQYKKAIEHHTMALDINREIGDRRVEGSALTNLGTAYLSLGQYEKALERLAAATAVFDALWAGLRTDHDRITFGDTIGFTLTPRLLQRVHARLAQPEAALEVAERARSRAFELLLAQQRVQRGADAAAAPPPTLPAAVDVAALRGLAGRQRVALVIFSQVQDTALLAWVVRGDAPVAFHELAVPAQGGASPLTQLVEQTRQTIGAIEAERGDGRTAAPDESYIRAALARCYKLLIAPLGLSAGEPLLIIPDRDLFALPFAALLDSDGKHLIERHSLRIAPSAGTLIELEQRAADRGAPPPRPPALVVGDPDFSGWTTKGGGHLSQLPGARAETSVVQGLLNTFKAKLRLDDEATKEAMMQLLPTSDVIHLATHGAPDGLYFAGESEVEATLSMAEVQGLDLRARLVVLSACDSFKAPKGEGGSELSTDGVVGITRAFVAAGALTLVSSLWKVSDDATRELMRRFYTAWVAGGDVAAALREAMVGMIEEGRWSVREWGAFVVYGMA
ncbi:hypothetical protein EMIHUDRAFT_69905, partial [Emiliania huxleyi CCMP1516]|uniref:CHAT domain-containing protein n=2 Tax=Emiliania huxleyi TaxID=2903 RepID=A0A0D3KW36_EMIH1